MAKARRKKVPNSQKPSRKPSKKTKVARWRNRLLLVVVAVVALVLIVLDVRVYSQFQGRKWSLPAHVYSRALELYPGLALSRDQLLWEHDQLGYRRAVDAKVRGQVSVARNRVDVYTRGFAFWDSSEPSRKLRLVFDGRQLLSIHSQGQPLALARLEPLRIGGIYPAHMEDRELVRLSDLPPLLVETLVAVEDRGFYGHMGVSVRGIARAVKANLQQGRTVQGGSTLTQQLVKNFYLNQQRTLSRKLQEAVMAVMLELHFDKNEILETYLNEVYLGQSGQRGIHGFAMASRHYFQKPVDELELSEVALLVALVKGASYYNPWRYPERALERRNLVLDVLARDGDLSPQRIAEARKQPLGVVPKDRRRKNDFPSYLSLVKRQLQKDYGDDVLRSEGLRVFTNFDPHVQRSLERTLVNRLGAIERDYRLSTDTLQVASLVVQVGTAEVVAMVGDRKPGYAGFNRALDASRPVGSTIKPAVYLAALQDPDKFTLATLIDDSPLVVRSDTGEEWRPRNFSRESHGEVPLYQALAYSYNQAAARLGMMVGIPVVAEAVTRLGYAETVQEVPSLMLGAVTMSPFQVAEQYHTLAAGGFHSPLRAIRAVYDANNVPLKRYPYAVEQRFSPQLMHLMQYALQVVMREGTGKSAYQKLPQTLSLAGKTGTSNDQRDSWFAGYSGSYLNVVWVGRDDNGKMPLTGGTAALPIWTDVMSELEHQPLAFEQPEGVSYQWVDSQGKLSSRYCAGARYLPFIAGSEPREKGRCQATKAEQVIDWLRDKLGW